MGSTILTYRWQPPVAALLATLFLGCWNKASATLIDRGNGLIFDDVLNITWLQNANLLGGTLGRTGALAWAVDLDFGGFTDWRLPLMDLDGDGVVVDCDTAGEPQCRDNELGYMYYQNLNGAGGDKRGNQIGDGGVVILDIQTVYWSSTVFAPNPNRSWAFHFSNGFQEDRAAGGGNFVWAVRPGDSVVIPEPALIELATCGVIFMLGCAASRRRAGRRLDLKAHHQRLAQGRA